VFSGYVHSLPVRFENGIPRVATKKSLPVAEVADPLIGTYSGKTEIEFVDEIKSLVCEGESECRIIR
jgi:hypothetical protein